MTSITDSSSRLRSTPGSRIGRPLVRHGLEMFLAMAVGMLVLGEARSMVGLDVPFAEYAGSSYALMATDMAVAMAAWMRFRGHAWAPTLEMCVAMYLPLLLLPLVWIDAMSSMAFVVVGHILMVVAMVAVLWRHHGVRTYEREEPE